MSSTEIETLFRQHKIPFTFMEEGYWRLNYGEFVILVFHNKESEFLRFVMPLMSVPENCKEEVYRYLLELNCTGIFCGSLAIHPDSDSIVCLNQIPTVNLEFSEITATLSSFVHIIDNHLTNIKQICGNSSKGFG